MRQSDLARLPSVLIFIALLAFFALGGYMIGMRLMYARTEENVVVSLLNGGLPATSEEIGQGIATQIFGVVGASDLPAIRGFAHSLPLQLTLVVEHDMEFVRRLNCRVTVLHEGSVLAEGSLDHVTRNQEVIDVYLGRG